MTNKVITRYWDANCFIALFNREQTTDAVYLAALETSFSEMLDGKLHIITSTLFLAEVFPRPEHSFIVTQLSSCPHFSMVETLSSVYALAGELRQKCSAAKQSLKTPDALHMAAGHLARANEIWTTDSNLIRKSEAGLLTTTPVCYPHVHQFRMVFE